MFGLAVPAPHIRPVSKSGPDRTVVPIGRIEQFAKIPFLGLAQLGVFSHSRDSPDENFAL
jgi:hypothetical protein